ncbi:carbon-nitrogen hydrolase family protein [Methanobrevibacter woesei]|uniref:carbon-nitrogen hydrolase family protein n=1 Tax=Methanobrevibacter woesei TaxID=190976 RepID=UPI00255C018D|nr:carbon-nitrogen hydrolase family protein [Methanobrevibacter woesei]
MTNIKIALCQMNVIDNKEENLKKAIYMIKTASEKDADLIILPEMFNCPYENEKFMEYSEDTENSYTLNLISKTASEEKKYIIAGSIPEKEATSTSERIYNTSFMFNPDGKIIAKHRKMHLFDIDVKGKIYFKESDTLTAGNQITIAETSFGKIGIGICYDIRFPELARLMALEGADILCYPGAFNLTTGPAHWEMLFKARACDNQVFTIGVAPALDKNANYNSYGHSLIVNPWGEIISSASFEEELIIAEIDLNEIKKVREELPLLKNRRKDIYNLEKK